MDMSGLKIGTGDEVEAGSRVSQYLAENFPRRWAHSQAVAARAVELAELTALTGSEKTTLVVAAWYHDIGYAVQDGHGWHPLDGASLAENLGVKETVVNLVAWHTTAQEEAELLGLTDALKQYPKPDGIISDLLTYADMTTGPDGQKTSFEERFAEIKERHGEESTPYLAMQQAWPRLVELQKRVTTYLWV